MNYLLLKGDVGKAKPFTHDLPSKDFIYGRPLPKNEENAQLCNIQYKSKYLVTTKWKIHE